MAYLQSYRTSDSSRKITTYLFKNTNKYIAFDFGSNDIPVYDVKHLDYIFITHEHSDHFMGLYNIEYAEALLESKCQIYASNVTKDLIIAIFENSLRVDLDKRSTKIIRDLLNKIKGVLFFEKIKLTNEIYFKLFPSGHTFGSSMVYLHGEQFKMLYTGDIDYDAYDADRQYQLDLKDDEEVDYLIIDGTYLDSNKFKDEILTNIRDNILTKKFNNFYCKIEKTVFFAKKLMSLPKLKDKYCAVFSSEMKWYLEILKKYNYDPFVTDTIVMDSKIYALPEGRIPLFVTSKKTNKQTNANGLLGLHMPFQETEYFIQCFQPSKTKILIGHYNNDKKKEILDTFKTSKFACDYQYYVLDGGQFEL